MKPRKSINRKIINRMKNKKENFKIKNLFQKIMILKRDIMIILLKI